MWYNDAEQFKSQCGYEINGFWYPRVTKIVDIKSKPALYKYYADAASYSEASAQTKKSAAEGTKIHEAVEKILKGDESQIDDDIFPSITAFKEFLTSNNIQVSPEHVEKRIVHYDHRYAGTIDTLALIGGKFGVLDIKTSQAIYRDYNLQTSAYMGALQNEFPNLQTRWILRIDQIRNCFICNATSRAKGGREKIRASKNSKVCPDDMHQWSEIHGQIELQEFPYWHQDFEAFLAAKRLWEWENEFWLKRVGYIA